MNFFKQLFTMPVQTAGQKVKPRLHIQTEQSTVPFVFDGQKVPQPLGPLLGKGGEGKVYPLQQRPAILVKLYAPDVLSKEQAYLKQKIEAMCQLRGLFKANNLSWPAMSVYGEQGQWMGYAMPKVAGRTLQSLAHVKLYQKYAPALTRQDLVHLLIDWLKLIRLLHRHQVMIGDYNLSNFMWDPDSLTIGLIDCDSYQISLNGKHYPCLVGSPDLTAPEHHGKSFKEVRRTLQSEYFSMAIVLFKCLMLGRHPYDVVGGNDPVSNLRQGAFAYGKGQQGYRNIPKGNWYNIWSHMPYRLKTLFIQTFTLGVRDPSQRATLEQWLDALELYLREMDKGFHQIEIIPSAPKSAEHRN